MFNRMYTKDYIPLIAMYIKMFSNHERLSEERLFTKSSHHQDAP